MFRIPFRKDKKGKGKANLNPNFGRTRPSRDVIFFGQNLAKKSEIISVHEVWEP